MNASVSDYRINLFDQEMQGSAVPSFVKERTLLEEAKELKREFSCGKGKIVTSSPQMLRVIDIARRVANTDVSVLLLGESGVGKDIIAHFIHNESNRFGNPFVKVNCAALPEELLESETEALSQVLSRTRPVSSNRLIGERCSSMKLPK